PNGERLSPYCGLETKVTLSNNLRQSPTPHLGPLPVEAERVTFLAHLCVLLRLESARGDGWSYFSEAAAGGVCLMNLLAHAMKCFMFDRSSCPPSCWRQASSPSSKPVFTGGIFAVR